MKFNSIKTPVVDTNTGTREYNKEYGKRVRNADFLVFKFYLNYFFKIDFVMKHLPKAIMILLTRRSVGPIRLMNYE
jgi:hypothetical protein